MKCFLIIIALFAFIISCTNNTKKEVDSSQTLSEAIELGAPSIEKDWSPEDYKNFNLYLTKISANSYPILSSSKSKDLFSKVISSISPPIMTNPNFPINQKMALGLGIQQELLKIMNQYMISYNNGNNYSMELSHLMGLSLINSSQIISFTNEIIPTFDPNNENYAIRLEGLEQMKNGSATQLDGSLVSLNETEIYSDEERLIFAGYFAEYSSPIINFVKPSVKHQFQIKLDKFIKEEKNAEIKRILTKLIESF